MDRGPLGAHAGTKSTFNNVPARDCEIANRCGAGGIPGLNRVGKRLEARDDRIALARNRANMATQTATISCVISTRAAEKIFLEYEPKKPAPDLIRGGCRFSEKIMLQQ